MDPELRIGDKVRFDVGGWGAILEIVEINKDTILAKDVCNGNMTIRSNKEDFKKVLG